jgi:hypothetical protein
MAFSIGGVIDGFELNVFVQRRSLNRGWKSHPRGRLYRQMEAYYAANAGTLCFSRPIHCDETAKPTFVEFGILKPDGALWVEAFENRWTRVDRPALGRRLHLDTGDEVIMSISGDVSRAMLSRYPTCAWRRNGGPSMRSPHGRGPLTRSEANK